MAGIFTSVGILFLCKYPQNHRKSILIPCKDNFCDDQLLKDDVHSKSVQKSVLCCTVVQGSWTYVQWPAGQLDSSEVTVDVSIYEMDVRKEELEEQGAGAEGS